MRNTFLLLAFIFVGKNIYAQDLPSLLGKAYNSVEVQKLMNSMQEEPKESFIPFKRSYKLSYKAHGAELEFNSDMSLYSLHLYDSGFSFQAYKGKLPFEINWQWDSAAVQEKSGVLGGNEDNPYVKYYISENWTGDFYFKGNKLELIRLTASEALIRKTSSFTLEGWGFRLFPDGKAVNGNVLDGEGEMVWGNNVARYKGEWSYGLPHGNGIYTDSLGTRYEGEFKLGFFWGKGKFSSVQQAFNYKGEFVMGKKHGEGRIAHGNGITYEGDWFRDNMQGEGLYRVNTEYYYQGEMADNNFNGKGILYTPDGYIKGKFVNGKPHGYCEQFGSQSNQTLSGYWVSGKKEGEFNLNTFGYDQKIYFENDIEIIKGQSAD